MNKQGKSRVRPITTENKPMVARRLMRGWAKWRKGSGRYRLLVMEWIKSWE